MSLSNFDLGIVMKNSILFALLVLVGLDLGIHFSPIAQASQGESFSYLAVPAGGDNPSADNVQRAIDRLESKGFHYVGSIGTVLIGKK